MKGYLDISVHRGSILEEFFRIEFQTQQPLREHPSRNPLSYQNVKKIKLWLKECGKKHKICNSNKTSFSPTRLIAVGSSGDPLRIVLSEGRPLKYVALSYCWGKPEIVAPSMTKSTNLTDRLAGFPEAGLPRTLQDAIHVIRRLDIRYIWIDALCIIQDNINDWEKEAKTMGSIYENAYFTIAATAAKGSSEGFLTRPSCCKLEIPFTVTEQDKVVQGGTFYLGYPWHSPTDTLISTSKWRRRGWVFQEQILSTRILYFTNDILYFECLSTQKVEDDVYGLPPALVTPWFRDAKIQKRRLRSGPTGVDAYPYWYSVVEEYAEREFSFPEDKLPAISGLAQKMARTIDDRYLAGLWKGDLHRGLLWRPRIKMHMTRPPQPGAPSWSWAALDGEIEWDRVSFLRACSIEILNAEITPFGPDPMGRVTGGQLVLSGKFLPVGKVLRHPRRVRAGDYTDSDHGEAHCDLYDLDFDISSEGSIQALMVVDGEGLLLEPADHSGEQNEGHRRIGYFECDLSVFDQVEPRVITII
ncbi:hypothetical protein GP486_004066 [Trichoglossum hirsutum]|uniref:Heterokaryon incompatibility domain-containing protein n=1 Tax=Trichoglossum hirsutum TaxID=265104 RepID=A0A9P8LBT7_9PEZI|nr:hypothetical protein GP486_004066 [Trichoglossum hirsutum]